MTMALFDLSHPLEAGMPIFPGDPPVSITQTATVTSDGANVSMLQFGSHTGTHLDAPAHVVEGGTTVDQLSLELLHGPARVLQIRPTRLAALQSRGLQPQDLGPLPVSLPRIVCVATGWDEYFYTEQREKHPYLELDFAKQLWQRGARVLGVDTLSPDPTAASSSGLPVHEFWLGQGGVIVENLRGLTQLSEQVQMSLLPLNLRGVDGSPIRAVAWEDSTSNR
jgi:kynurenine formamidase